MENQESLYEDMREDLFPGTSPKAIILADSRTSSMFMAQTLKLHLPEETTIFFDWASPLGAEMVKERVNENLPTGLISFGEEHFETIPDEYKNVLPHLEITSLGPESLRSLKARIILVPAMAGSGEIFIDPTQNSIPLDFGPNTISGRFSDAAYHADLATVIIDTPERGLVRFPDKDGEQVYARRFMVVGLEPDLPMDEEIVETEIVEDSDNSEAKADPTEKIIDAKIVEDE